MWDFRPVVPGGFRAPARPVRRVFLHCTDSDNAGLAGIGLAQEVNRWHLANGWAGIGYHFIIDKAGVVVSGRPLELTPSAQLGRDGLGNVASIAISTHGAHRWTAEGLAATRNLCAEIDAVYRAAGRPVTFHGHCEIDPRPCPVYPYGPLLGLDDAGAYGARPFMSPEKAAQVASYGAPAKLAITDAVSSAIAGRDLVEGCTGQDVKSLQIRLGIDLAQVDGWFGRVTLAHVVAFQDAKGLAPDGVVGAKTRAALGL